MSSTNTTTDNGRRFSLRTRVIAAAVLCAGVTGAVLTMTGTAGAATADAQVSAKSPVVPAAVNAAQGAASLGRAAAAAANPVQVINSVTQPDQAQAAMKLFDAGTNKKFVLTTQPVFKQTGWVVAGGGESTNNGNDSIPYTYTDEDSTTSSWSLGGSFETSISGGIGVAEATASLTLSASHEWGNIHSDAVEINATVGPKETVMVMKNTSDATYTGTYYFTANGTDYQITDVTVTTPGSATDKGNPRNAVSYEIVNAGNVNAAAAIGVPAQGFNAKNLTEAQLNTIASKLHLDK